MRSEPPWRRQAALVRLMAAWRRRLAGQVVTRVTAGPGWLGLTVTNDQQTHLQFVVRPGAVMLWDAPHPLSAVMTRALGQSRHPPLVPLLQGSRLVTAGILPDDRIVVLGFLSPVTTDPESRTSAGKASADLKALEAREVPEKTEASVAPEAPAGAVPPDRYLFQQLFGPCGNLLLLDGQRKVLWALRRPPHSQLTDLPPQAAFSFTAGAPDPSGDSLDICGGIAAEFRSAAVAHLTGKLEEEWQARLTRGLLQVERSEQRLVTNLRRDLDTADRGEEHRRAAETLAAHLNSVPRGAHEAVLPSPHDGEAVSIPLNPSLTAAANLEQLFHLARKAARGRDVIAGRLKDAEARLSTLTEQRQELANLATQPSGRLAALLAWAAAHGEEVGIPRPHRARRARIPDEDVATLRPFRRYLVDDRWEVWVGRNQRENDELTHRRAAPNDFWFHAQAVTGSHVVLRTQGKPEQVPQRVLVKVASLAALHSKGRHSALVPVVYTLRKYVRKPRKTPPGTAAFIREKSLMVEPRLAPSVVAV